MLVISTVTNLLVIYTSTQFAGTTRTVNRMKQSNLH